MRRRTIIIGGTKKKAVKKKPAKKRPGKRVHASPRTRVPAPAMPAQTESDDERVRRAVERVQAEGRIDTAQLAKAMRSLHEGDSMENVAWNAGYRAAMRDLMVLLADTLTDAALEMKPVKSKNIDAVGYDHKGRLLRVVFQGGRSYDYTDVPPETVADLWLASSVGSFIHRRVKPNHPALARG